MSANTILLEVSDLHAGYGAARILHGISLQVRDGSVTALIGANGAGKTTLMRTLAGLIMPTGGSIVFADFHLDVDRLVEDLEQA